MTGSPEGTMDVLHQLLAERSRYEAWIAQLELKRQSAPGHVLERVRNDYAARLEHVVTQLRGRAAELEETAASLRSRLAAVAVEEGTRRDERAETELRAAVGEYTEEEARETFERCDAAIASLVGQRDGLGSELARLQEVLVQVVVRDTGFDVDGPQVAAESPPEPQPVAQVPQEEALVVEHAPTEDVAPVLDVPAPSAAAELEFLRSLVSPAAAEPESPEFVAPPVLAAPRRQPTPMSATTIRDPLRTTVGDVGGGATSAMNFLKDSPTEQVKTLKCQECGTMNFPTEWYCERCGGELAAM